MMTFLTTGFRFVFSCTLFVWASCFFLVFQFSPKVIIVCNSICPTGHQIAMLLHCLFVVMRNVGAIAAHNLPFVLYISAVAHIIEQHLKLNWRVVRLVIHFYRPFNDWSLPSDNLLSMNNDGQQAHWHCFM